MHPDSALIISTSHTHGSISGHEQVISIDISPYPPSGLRAHDSTNECTTPASSALLFDIDDDVNPPAEALTLAHAQDANAMSDDMQQDTGLLFDIDDGPDQATGQRQEAAHVPAASDCQPGSAPTHRQDALPVGQGGEQDNGLLFDIEDGPVQQPTDRGHLNTPSGSQGEIYLPSTSLGSLRQASAFLHQQASLAAEELYNTVGSTLDQKSGMTNGPSGSSPMHQHQPTGNAFTVDVDAEVTLPPQQKADCSRAAAAQQSTVCMSRDQRISSAGALSTQATVQLPAAPRPVLPVKRPAASQQTGQLQQQVPKPSLSQQQQQQQQVPRSSLSQQQQLQQVPRSSLSQQQVPKTGYLMMPTGAGAFKAPRRVISPALAAASAPDAKYLSAPGTAVRFPPLPPTFPLIGLLRAVVDICCGFHRLLPLCHHPPTSIIVY